MKKTNVELGVLVLILALACFLIPDRAPPAQASEPDYGRVIRQLNQNIQALQKRVEDLESLPTAKKELAAKRRAERDR